VSSEIDDEYRRRLAARRAALAERERASLWMSRARLSLAGLAAAILIVGGFTAANWLLVPLALFVVSIGVHARLLNSRDRARSAVAYYERALARRAHAWIGRGSQGERFRQPEHPFAEDLDLFGRGSLFELLSTARTQAGEETLARWLLEPAPPDEARARQEAVRELASRLDLRETVAVLGDGVGVGVHAQALRSWSRAPIALQGGVTRVALLLLGISTIAAVVPWLLALVFFVPAAIDRLPGSPAAFLALTIAVLVATGTAAWWFMARASAVVQGVETPSRDLDLLEAILRTLEAERFESPWLVRLHGELGGTSRPASGEIARLAQLVALLNSRRNVMFVIPASLLLWGTQFAFAIEHWRARVGDHVPRWLDAIGEFEALSSLATFGAEHPDYAYPEFSPSPATLRATAVAHPLLSDTAVANDIAIGGDQPRLFVVSGSNMSGKSTFLRALGVNVTLAQAGAPVRAVRLALSPLTLGASIRIQDSLQDGRSRFMAEILRLKQIVDLAKNRPDHVLFLLDEILGGTNSHDRRIGAEALLDGLVDLGAIGLVTTHDLALGAIADKLGPRAANVHFEDHFEEGELVFDYRLREGVVRTSNAIPLMRSIGLDV